MKTFKKIVIAILSLTFYGQLVLAMNERALKTAAEARAREEEAMIQEAIRLSLTESSQRPPVSSGSAASSASQVAPIAAYVPSQQGTLRTYALIINVEHLPTVIQKVRGLIRNVKDEITQINNIRDPDCNFFPIEQEKINRINAGYHNAASVLPTDLHKARPQKIDSSTATPEQINAKNKEIVRFNNEQILPYNQSHPTAPIRLLTLIPPKQKCLSFYEQDPDNIHITLPTLGDMYDGDPRRNDIINQVVRTVETAINEWSVSQQCGPLDLTTGSIKWPPYGSHQKIWVPLAILPQSRQSGEALLSLLDTIKNHLQRVQTQNGNCFMDSAKLPKTFRTYTPQERNEVLTGNNLHISLGRLNPPYIKEVLARNQPSARAKLVRNMIGENVWVDADGKAIWEETERFNFIDGLSSVQRNNILQILGISGLGPDMFGNEFKLVDSEFTVTRIQFTSKSTETATDTELYATFLMPPCSKKSVVQTESGQASTREQTTPQFGGAAQTSLSSFYDESPAEQAAWARLTEGRNAANSGDYQGARAIFEEVAQNRNAGRAAIKARKLITILDLGRWNGD